MEIEEWHPPTQSRMPEGPQSFPPSGVNSLASLGARGVARVLDALVLAVPYLLLAFVVWVATQGTDPAMAESMEPSTRDTVVLTAPFLAMAIVYETVAVTLWGQTLGKLVVGIRVARQANGRCPLWWESALRIGLPSAVAVIPHPLAISVAMGLYVTAGFDPLRRNVVDRAAGTVVVRSPVGPSEAAPAARPNVERAIRDFSDDLSRLRTSLGEAHQYLRIDDLRHRRSQLETEASRPDLWDDPEVARQVTGELASLIDDVDAYEGLEAGIEDAETLAEMAREEGDEGLEPEIEASIGELRERFSRLELRSLFTGEHDESDAICEVQSGEGGADAQDWANMLLRMYLRWAERRGFDTELDEVSEGSEAGISSATFIVKGRHAYGLLRSEHGVHRLVRMSPFNAQGKRQTAFAAVKVTPLLEDVPDVVVDDKDLRIDVYRSSGAGGQHVNVTDSAVRITHLPTGIVVSCQNERSQHQNKDRAMQVLMAKLAEVARQEREDELSAIRGVQRSVGFGSQIRSYVLQPYQMVKDLRSDHETANVDPVLDGDLDPFIEAYLRWRRSEDLADV